MCLFTLAEVVYLEQYEPFSTLKTVICQKYSLQNLTQFSQGSNVLDAPAPNTEGVFLERNMCFFSIAE
jgi:hypothetical protein